MGMKARAEKASRAERVAAYSLRICLIRTIALVDRPLGAYALGGNAVYALPQTFSSNIRPERHSSEALSVSVS
jgi:hypothetical protein